MNGDMKYCEFCGSQIHSEAVICPKCGRQLEKLKMQEEKSNPQIIINNTIDGNYGRKKCDKWVALLLCFFLGYLGGHKFYEGKLGLGILYIFTFGLFGIGFIVDFIVLLFKPNPYYI